MPIAKGQGRARGSKAIAPDEVPSSEVRSDLLDAGTPELALMDRREQDKKGLSIAALPPAERAVIVLNSTKTEQDLRAMVIESARIGTVIDQAGRELAHRTGMTLKNARVSIEKAGKTAREDAQAFSKAVIAEEKRLIALTEAEESRVFKLRDEYDAEQARLKEEAERLARERVASIRAKIDTIAHLPSTLGGADSARLVEELQKLVAMQPTAEEFDGMLAEMLLTIETVGSALSALLDGARKREEAERQRIADQEAERARLAAQAEENARIAAELERKRLEAEAAAKAQTDELARLRADMERERAELEALREAMKPNPEPYPVPDVAVSEPQSAAFTLVPTDADHAPQFDWNTPAEHLEAIATTPPAVEPAIDFAALDEPEAAHTEAADTFSYHLGQFFDAVRIMRQTRTADEVRKHLEVALADVQAEIAQGARGYK